MERESTLRGLYSSACSRLEDMGVENARHEALLLCMHCFGISGRLDITTRGGEIMNAACVGKFNECVEQRAFRPLQYILGSWEFCGMELSVGEGVLVPRDDTTALVETVCAFGADIAAPRILDLCAGSGAVGLACARELPDSRAVCVELSELALPYLKENVRRFGSGRVFVHKADVLKAPDAESTEKYGCFDIICSNPPYIRTEEIDGLSREVRREPRMALDGGADGCVFYRAITALWSGLLRKGGMLAFEIGAGMESSVAEILRENGFEHIGTKTDMQNIIRTVYGTKAN